jgi:hypothetical protein
MLDTYVEIQRGAIFIGESGTGKVQSIFAMDNSSGPELINLTEPVLFSGHTPER